MNCFNILLPPFYYFLCLSILLTVVKSIKLSSQEIKSCSNGKFEVTAFDLDIDPDINQLTVNIEADVREELKEANAKITLTLFDSDIQDLNINLCQSSLGVSSCPINKGSFKFKNTQNLPSQISTIITKINSVTGLNIGAKIQLTDNQGNDLGCVKLGLGKQSNSIQKGLKYTTVGMVSASALLSLLGGLMSQNSARINNHVTPSITDVMGLYQFITTTGMLSLDYPDIYTNYVSSFGWTMGLINMDKFQSAYDKITFKNSNSNNDTNIIQKRSTEQVDKQVNGVSNYSKILKIEPRNLFLTVLVIFLVVFSAITALCLIFRLILELLSKFKPTLFSKLRNHFALYYVGNLLRVFVIGYNAIAMAAFYQLTVKDTNIGITILAVIILAVFCIILMGFVAFRIIKAGPNKLFSKPSLQYKYGALYTDYKLKIYAFFVPLLIYQIFRAAIIGLLYKNVYVQMVLIICNEIVMFLALIILRPYASKFTNLLNVSLWFFRIINLAILFLFISTVPLNNLAKSIVSGILIAIQAICTILQALVLIFNLIRTVINLITNKENKDSDNKTQDNTSITDKINSRHSFNDTHINNNEQSSTNTKTVDQLRKQYAF